MGGADRVLALSRRRGRFGGGAIREEYSRRREAPPARASFRPRAKKLGGADRRPAEPPLSQFRQGTAQQRRPHALHALLQGFGSLRDGLPAKREKPGALDCVDQRLGQKTRRPLRRREDAGAQFGGETPTGRQSRHGIAESRQRARRLLITPLSSYSPTGASPRAPSTPTPRRAIYPGRRRRR